MSMSPQKECKFDSIYKENFKHLDKIRMSLPSCISKTMRNSRKSSKIRQCIKGSQKSFKHLFAYQIYFQFTLQLFAKLHT